VREHRDRDLETASAKIPQGRLHRVRLYESPDLSRITMARRRRRERSIFRGAIRSRPRHRLHSPAFSEAENLRVYGKCNNPYGHGHNYTIEVTLSGAWIPPLGWSPTSAISIRLCSDTYWMPSITET